MFDQTLQLIANYLPNLLGALAILIVGWLVASLLSGLVRNGLKRTNLDERLARALGAKEAQVPRIESWIAKGIFYLIMLFVIVAFIQALGLTIVAEPLNRLLTQVMEYAPRLLSAGVLLIVAWILATVLRILVLRVAGAANLDQRLTGSSGEKMGVTKTLGDLVYYLVFLLFLPAILDALSLQGLLQPVQSMLDKALGFLPNLAAAAIILVVGVFIANIVRNIVAGLLATVGADRLSERVGLTSVLGRQSVSGLLGLLVYALILIPVLTAALNALGLDAVTVPVSNVLNTLLGALPNLFAAAIILIIAYVVGRVVAGLVTNILTGFGVNSLPERLGLHRETTVGARPLADILGYLVLVAIMLFALIEAARLLGFVALSTMMTDFTLLLGQVLLGLVILGIGLYLANLVAGFVAESGTANAGVLATAARVAILVLAGAMALRQMGIANDIINLAFGLLLGAVAVAVALAFGLGGRETAGRLAARWVAALEHRNEPKGPPTFTA